MQNIYNDNIPEIVLTQLIFDAEGTGLYFDCTRIWCIVTKDIKEKTVLQYRPNEVDVALSRLLEADTLIGHNIIGYDIPVFKKLYGWEPRDGQKIIDTYVLSRLLNPERRGHSIEYWGNLFGVQKPVHEDWSQFSEDMLYRCTQDVNINYRMYIQLLREMKNV